MATLDGSPIFGAAVIMATSDEDRSTQVNSFFGLNGLEALDGGSRGRSTHVTGILFGSDPGNLASAIENFRSYNDGVYRTLVDTVGVTWLNVRLKSFQPQERKFAHSQLGYCQRYSATFHHLS